MLKLFKPDYCTPAIGLQAPLFDVHTSAVQELGKEIFDDNGQLIIRHDI
jgi:hypothetical protein